jgi:ferredoxin-nitrite reductase
MILTSRSGVQLHEIEADDVLAVWKKLNSCGLSTWQSLGDNIRNIVSDVYDGIGVHSEIETYPIIMQMQEHILQNPRYVGMLPRRVSIGLSGNRANVSSFFGNDIYFALAQKDDVFGFNVYMGGKNTEVAQDADIFLKAEEVFDFYKAFVEVFYLYGSRESRSKTRLFYLIESIGMNALRAHLMNHYGDKFQTKGELLLNKVEFTQNETLKDGSFAFCYQTDFARVTPDEIEKIAAFVDANAAEVRIGIDQNLYIIGLKTKETPFVSPKQSATIVACAGNLCPFSFWSIKNETSYLPLEKIEEHSIEVGFSGCVKGCGRHRHTDIGLIGLKTNHFGDTEGGARVFIGAEHTYGKSVGRLLFAMVPFEHLHEVLSLLISLYEKSGCSSFEEFSSEVLNRFSVEFLALWILANFEAKTVLTLEIDNTLEIDFDYEKNLLKRHFGNLELIENSFSSTVSALSKKLWTIEGEDPNYIPPMKRVQFR